jgi:hypothetical protein
VLLPLRCVIVCVALAQVFATDVDVRFVSYVGREVLGEATHVH